MPISLDGKTTVRELVGRYPQTRKVFEEHGIDYCCGGGQSLAAAASQRGLTLPNLTQALEKALTAVPAASADRDWYAAPLDELVGHIVDVHHGYLQRALPRLRLLSRTVLNAHGEHHGEMLRQVQHLFDTLDAELTQHLAKEEQVLFPYIVGLERHARHAEPRPHACFGSVSNPIQQMEHEHDSAGTVLAQLRQVTNDYRLPQDACPTFATLYEEFQHLEADLHLHIHLENNILFPRASELEGQLPAVSC